MKIAVVGGGSTYTPELVDGFARRQEQLPIDELVLLDPDAARLEPVAGVAARILQKQGWTGRFSSTDDRDAALDGADFVVIQLRVGGQATRLLDETIPLKFGCIGQETTGAGGLAKALRTVPVVLDVADAVERRAKPGAWLVNFTNPVGIVTQALLDHGVRALGLCNVAIGFQRHFAERFGVTPDRLRLEHVGLNHLSWERAIFVDGVDRLPELVADSAEEIADQVGLPVELIRSVCAVPSYYLRYYYLTSDVIEEERSGEPRAEQVMKIERELLELYSDPTLDRKPELLERRGGAFYSEAAAQLIASLHDSTGDVQVVDVRNSGALPGLPDDAVVEIAARIDADGAHPLPLSPLAPELLGLVQLVKAYERLAVHAAIHGDRNAALQALLLNPLVGEYGKAAPLLDALLEANRAFLPRFAAYPSR